MKKILSLVTFSLTTLAMSADSGIVEAKLSPYKYYLMNGTYDSQDWSKFKTLPLSRYYTFRKAFEHFEQYGGKVIVELGTSRSFTHGGHPGCNLDDVRYWFPQSPEHWDWGAGFFTRMATESLQHLNPTIHTIDIMWQHINRCKVMTADFKHMIKYHVCSSLDFLRRCRAGSIDLLYLDTGDMWPIEPTAQLQLEEAKILVERNVLTKNGILLIDDVKNQTPVKFGETSGLGKSKYAIPYLLEHGFEIVENEYQVILRKK